MGQPLPPDAVRLAVFKSRRGSRGYREASVDAFLDRVVELLVVQTV
jgi:DivIVA domain-containing protein